MSHETIVFEIMLFPDVPAVGSLISLLNLSNCVLPQLCSINLIIFQTITYLKWINQILPWILTFGKEISSLMNQNKTISVSGHKYGQLHRLDRFISCLMMRYRKHHKSWNAHNKVPTSQGNNNDGASDCFLALRHSVLSSSYIGNARLLAAEHST